MKKKNLFDIHQEDARNIDKLIKEPIVDAIITSPPYFDMKDYGHKNQIGFGQSYNEYLDDLSEVFQKIYNVTKDTGSLWVIIDALRKNKELIPLPFNIADRLKKIGWVLKDVIIWEKDKTVPWTHKGQMRNSFEYILLFAKTDNFKFNMDRVRTYDSLKKWWVRYPERYSPDGKAPTGVWNFPIPTQGSWGNNYIKHFCPLPEEMVAQMIEISTDEGDVVLDPFSGTGTVLAKARNMNRKYIGTELNSEYIGMFKRYLADTHEKKLKEYKYSKNNFVSDDEFKRKILDLRALKYGRILRKLGESIVDTIRVEISSKKPEKDNHLIKVDYKVLLKKDVNAEEFEKILINNISKAPLSKFGIEPNIIYVSDISEVIHGNKKLFSYTDKITHKFYKELKKDEKLKSCETVISSICVDLNEQEYGDN